MKTSERSVLCTFVLQEKRTLFHSEFLQISENKDTLNEISLCITDVHAQNDQLTRNNKNITYE